MRKNKYNVCPAEQRTFENIVFHSKHEMLDYQRLRILEKAGAIVKLERQVKFPLFAHVPDGTPLMCSVVAHYVADFVATEKDGTLRVYDSKGVKTQMYALKKRFFEACYPHLRIVEL